MNKSTHKHTRMITKLILDAKKAAYKETSSEPEPGLTSKIEWPVDCTVGPGLEGAIACETKIGYVNGSKGWLIYRGYDIFDLCAYSTFEEVSYLLLHGEFPTIDQLDEYKAKLIEYRHLPETKRLLMGFPIEKMSPMSGLRLGANLMRQTQTYRDDACVEPASEAIYTDEDSIPMETKPMGEKKPIYEFTPNQYRRPKNAEKKLTGSEDLESCYHLNAGIASIAAAIARIHAGHLPLEPNPKLNHAANLLYMMTGEEPSPLEERLMDVCLILHADHGMNASTFASMVVASTLSDIYFSIGAGIGALNGPLHGGANEQVIQMLSEIPDVESVPSWYNEARNQKKKIMGFGHRVYKAYDPRARILKPIVNLLVKKDPEMTKLYDIANALETEVVSTLGKEKKIFPNVDYYSGILYRVLGIKPEFYTSLFAVSRVAGWTARVLEYLQNNRIFRPRAMYIGDFNKKYVPINQRDKK